MLSTLNLPVRPSPQKGTPNPRKHLLSDSELSQLESPPSSDPFAHWTDSETDDALEDIPSLGYIFPTDNELVDFAKD